MTTANARQAGSPWVLGASLLVVGLSAVVGIAATRASAEARDAAGRWQRTMEVQRPGGSPRRLDSALLSEARQASALGVTPDSQARVIGEVERIARSGSLASIRVAGVAPPKAAFAPERRLHGLIVRPAPYAVTVEFTGRFVDARKFVNSLPPSVSVTQLEAARTTGATQYKLLLSVYELHGKSIP